MPFLEKINNLKGATILKLISLVLAVILVSALFIQILGATLFYKISSTGNKLIQGGALNNAFSPDLGLDYAVEDSAVRLSLRNAANQYEPDSPSGSTAEDFEIKEYEARIETRNNEFETDTDICSPICSYRPGRSCSCTIVDARYFSFRYNQASRFVSRSN